MQATEERNDWKRYCSFYPLLLCLWAVAHCPNYVVLTASEIAHWALASAAQLAFQTHYGFCRLSRFEVAVVRSVYGAAHQRHALLVW